MRVIKLIIQKEEDLVLLMQGINWVRQHCLESTKNIFDIADKMKGKSQETILKAVDNHVETHNRLMTLIAQLDDLLEYKQEVVK